MEFGWINEFGAAIIIIMMIPNILFAIKNKDMINQCDNRLMNVIEQIGRYACFVLMWFPIFVWKFGFQSVFEMLAYIIGSGVLLIVYLVIWVFYFKKPTMKTAVALNISRATAYRYLIEMDDRGMVEYDGQEIQTAVTKKLNSEINRTAIVGSVPCGSPQYEEENIEEYISLPTAIFGKGEFFILRASGQSMIEAGIDDGDLVVVRKQNVADEGDIIVALVDNESTLKRFYRDKKIRRLFYTPKINE